jgi:Putative beta-barrel porin-2, OmpL-like. bbp2
MKTRNATWSLGLALLVSGSSVAWGQAPPAPPGNANRVISAVPPAAIPVAQTPAATGIMTAAAGTSLLLQTPGQAEPDTGESNIETRPTVENPAPEETPLGPTPLDKVGILQDLIYGDNAANSKIKFSGWLDADYTYRDTGHGINNIAPVMNRFGDEFLLREIGLIISKPLDPNELSWGFNSIFLAGADASFLTPTAGGWKNTNPRFGADWTDLNVTAHLPILTDGGVDIKAGRQTTVLGSQGAVAWARVFDSSDYAWYNMEEGRYTGISADWHISKQLDWYNGIEFGWGTFFDEIGPAPQYITQINYWLDEDAKKTKVWTTVLTGPTGKFSTGNTTVVELGVLQNWNRCLYQIIDSQMVYSKAPIFFPKPPGYQERAYDIYTILGYHLDPCLDFNSRLEWYDDVDGGGYPGGFGIPHTDYYEMTFGFNYHPKKWLEVRPEIRYDHATNPAFGSGENHKDQLSLAADALIKF